MATAQVGDRIVLDSDKVGVPARQGEILQVTPHQPHDEYRVRWDDGHVSEIRPAGASFRIVAKAPAAKASAAKGSAAKASSAPR